MAASPGSSAVPMFFTTAPIRHGAPFARATLAHSSAVGRGVAKGVPARTAPGKWPTPSSSIHAVSSPSSVAGRRSTSPPFCRDEHSNSETMVKPSSLSLAASRVAHEHDRRATGGVREAEAAVREAAAAFAREAKRHVRIPPQASRESRRQQGYLNTVLKKLRDGHMLTKAEMQNLESIEVQRAAEYKARKKELEERTARAAGTSLTEMVAQAKAAKLKAEAEAEATATRALQLAEQERLRAEAEAARSAIEERLRSEAEIADATLRAEEVRRRAEAAAIQAAEVARLAEEAQVAEAERARKVEEEEARRQKAEAAAAAAEALAQAHTERANAKLLAERAQAEAKAQQEAEEKERKRHKGYGQSPRTPRSPGRSPGRSPASKRPPSGKG